MYQFDDVSEFDPSADGDAGLMKLSGIAWIDDTRFIVLERTDSVAKLYVVDLEGATDILGTAWDDDATSPSLEQTTDYASAGIVPLTKTLLADLDQLDGIPDKIEGITIVDSSTVAVANDNDFDVNEYDADGMTIPTGRPSEIIVISIPDLG